MTEADVISVKLDRIRENVAILTDIQGVPYDTFVSNAMTYGAAQHYLQVAIQAVADICGYLVSERQLRPPGTSADSVLVLADAGVFGKELADRLVGMVKMRNVLVHEYLKVDARLIYDAIQYRLGDFDEFAHCIVEYLEREGIA